MLASSTSTCPNFAHLGVDPMTPKGSLNSLDISTPSSTSLPTTVLAITLPILVGTGILYAASQIAMHFVALRTISELEFPAGSQGEFLRDGALKDIRALGFWDSIRFNLSRNSAEVLVDPNLRSYFLDKAKRIDYPTSAISLLYEANDYGK